MVLYYFSNNTFLFLVAVGAQYGALSVAAISKLLKNSEIQLDNAKRYENDLREQLQTANSTIKFM